MSQHSTTMIDPKYLPNLPGFRPHQIRKSAGRKSCFDVVGGEVYLRPQYIPPADDHNEGSVTSIGNTIVTKARKQLLTTRNTILNFSAYFQEADGNVRYCNIYFYVENGTLKVVERPQVNAGVTQGTLVRRTVIARPDGQPISEEDLHVGSTVTIYGRQYNITDCDLTTRNYMREVFGYEEATLEAPEDPYMQSRRRLQPGSGDSGNQAWDRFRAKKNESKMFIEAKLGNGVDNSGREGFVKYGNTTLKFRCCWDNVSHLYGDVQWFTLSYYLADDTIEIVSIPPAHVKDSDRTKLLKRSKLPKDFHMTTGLGLRPPTEAFFHWSDFYIGMELDVYGRPLVIMDADSATRDFFADQQMALSNPIIPEAPEIIVHAREVPPPTGFGSEEDSLRSVAGSLMPGPPPMKKLGENKVLSFLCSLLSGGIDDVDRRFVLTFYVQDNTLKVIEPPVRNSGFTGGVFLSRRSVKKIAGSNQSTVTNTTAGTQGDNPNNITYRDLYVGCRLKVLMHEFLLLDTNDGTLRWMEDKGLPRANVFAVLDKVRYSLRADAQNGQLRQLFQHFESQMDKSDPNAGHAPGRVTKEELRQVFAAYNLINDENPEAISEHELRTLVRAAGNKLPTFEYEKFIQQVIQPTADYK